jgi:hypothetical protein
MHEKNKLMPKKLYIVSTMIYTYNALGKHRITTRELATTNDTNISMTHFFDANVHFPPQ